MIPDPTPPPILAKLARFVTPRPNFEATCERIACELRTLARAAYAAGDQRRGDRLTARGLYWQLCRDAGELLDV